MAKDDDFKRRYINRYEFVDVPRFRQDAIAWQQFVRSWCETIAEEAAKTGTAGMRSLVARAVRDAIEPRPIKFAKLNYDTIRDRLRKFWNSGDNVGDIVWGRDTEDDSYYRGRVANIHNDRLTIKYDDSYKETVRRQQVDSIGKFVSDYFNEDSKYEPLRGSDYSAP